MRIREDFILNNPRIEIISGDGEPTRLPRRWRPILPSGSMLVAIPDMHLFIRETSFDNFKYGAEAMSDFINHLQAVRMDVGCRTGRLHLYQLGDLYELRFPNPLTGRAVTIGEIRRSDDEYDEIMGALERLGTRFVYGNHDFENRHTDGVLLSDTAGGVYVEHGFTADRWYHFTNPGQPLFSAAMTGLREFRRMEASLVALRTRLGYIPRGRHAATGITSGDVERDDFPVMADYPTHQKQHFEHVIRERRRKGDDLRVCIVAHTHLPCIDSDFADGEAVYVDAGAWTDGRSDFVVVTDEEVAVCRYRRRAAVVETRLASLRPAI